MMRAGERTFNYRLSRLGWDQDMSFKSNCFHKEMALFLMLGAPISRPKKELLISKLHRGGGSDNTPSGM